MLKNPSKHSRFGTLKLPYGSVKIPGFSGSNFFSECRVVTRTCSSTNACQSIGIAHASLYSPFAKARGHWPRGTLALAPNHLHLYLIRALMGLWIFHHLMGGRRVWTPPPLSISAPAHRGTKGKTEQKGKRRSKAREKSFRNHICHFFAQVKIEVTRGQNSKILRNGFWTIK